MKTSRKMTRTKRDGRRAIRSARIELRLTPEQKRLIERASMLQGKTVSSYMADSAVSMAREELEQEHRIELSAEDSLRVAQALLNPRGPSKELIQAARDYVQGIRRPGF
jgi:uncharacterized protein (DUF1778 family)